MKFFTNSLNVSNYKILDQHEPKDRPKKTIPFDIELSHMFSFSPMQSNSTDFLETIISTISKMSYAWIQILFVRDDRIGDACSRHLYALQRAMADITKDKIELQGSIGSNFMPKYRKVRTSNDKHVPEFMRIAYPDYAQRDQDLVMPNRGSVTLRHTKDKEYRDLGSNFMPKYRKHAYFCKHVSSDAYTIEQLYNNAQRDQENLCAMKTANTMQSL